MPEPISISRTLSIRECGKDECWLQDQIYNNPAILGLGELEVVKRERQQSNGGRLDLLLKNPEDDSMYEVEIMLGETDETHIVRTIEYWDLEKRRWPQRQHFPVLVAESFNRRFFNVIQLLSLSIPIIAVQANMIEADEKKILHFSKTLDVYEEPEEDDRSLNEVYNEEWWRNKSAAAVECAKALFSIVSPLFPGMELNYVKSYVAFYLGNDMCFWFHKRGGNKSLLTFWVGEFQLPQVTEIFDTKGLFYRSQNQRVRVTVDRNLIESNTDLFRKIGALVKQSWKS
jgi:hypothetical protein